MAAIPAADRKMFVRCLKRLAEFADDRSNPTTGHVAETGPQRRLAGGE